MYNQTKTPLISLQNEQWKATLVQEFVGKRIQDLRTPSLVIDKSVLERNCNRLGDITSKLSKKVRVHVKTHKTVDAARLQLKGAKTDAIVVSTLAEANAMINSDLTTTGLLKDVLLGFPITPDKFAEILSLSTKVETFRIFIDDLQQFDELEAYSRKFQQETGKEGPFFHVLLKVDCGYHRAGIDTSISAIELARKLVDSPFIHLDGLYTHAGHSYSSKNSLEALEYLKNECHVARVFKTFFSDAGVDIKYVSIGATPTIKAILAFLDNPVIEMDDILKDIDEVHAGAYAFLDRQQVSTGLSSFKDVAISVACRVVSTYLNDRILIDGGALAFSKDTAPQGGFGYVTDSLVSRNYDQDPEIVASVKKISQEHGILEYINSDDKRLNVGDVVRVIPNHCCLAAASHLFYLIVENNSDVVTDVWVPVKGW